MKTLVILSLSIATTFGGETITPLKSGETDLFSYGLGCLVGNSKTTSNAPVGSDLILTLRNTGAKWIDMDGVTGEDFSLQDAKGNEMKLYPRSSPKSVAFNETTAIQLRVDRTGDTTPPWTLHFKSKSKAFVPFDLKIDGIEPPKSPPLDQETTKGEQTKPKVSVIPASPPSALMGSGCYTGSTSVNAGRLILGLPVTVVNEEKPSPIISVIKDAREFRSKNNEKLPKATSDEVLNLLNRFAGTFKPSERDCRVPEQGPKAALEPAHVVSFITPANENVSVELYVFSEKHSVLQISIGSKVKTFFLSTEKDLVGQFSKIMQKE